VLGKAREITHHNSDIFIVNAIVVDRRLQEVRVLLEPRRELIMCLINLNNLYLPFWQI
jgi:hypothetical protein